MTTPADLQHTLTLAEQLIAHCREHLQPADWAAFAQRLTTPTYPDYSMLEPWTSLEYCTYYWRRLSRTEQQAFLRAHGHPRRPK
jgi:hypothetical protein